MEKRGSIYKLTCLPTGKSYIGQTRDTKTKAGREYAYGVLGRWNDHCSCPSGTPLGLAIAQYGPDQFKVETIESDIPESRLDEREAHWITSIGTLIPSGYNKMRHGRCRHRDSSTLGHYYAPLTVGVRVKQIKRDGEPHLIYTYLQLKNGEEVRIVFGQGSSSSYASAITEAKEFLEAFNTLPVDVDPRVFDSGASEYQTKLEQFDGQTIGRIRLGKFNTLCAVYVDRQRICFGGKRSTFEEAVAKAGMFANALHLRHPEAILINEMSKSATGGCPPS
jgi:hypothetical protein